MSQPNKQPNIPHLPLTLQQQLLLQQRQARVAQTQAQNQIPLQYLPQNLAVQTQSKQMNRVATTSTVAALQMMQKQQQLNAAAVAQQQQFMTKQNYLTQNQLNFAQIQNLQAQQLLQQQQQQQQQKLQQQAFARQDNSPQQLLKNQNLAISIINELKKVTAELEQPNLTEAQKQALRTKKKGLEEFIVKIRLIQQQQQQQKEKQTQLQINSTSNQAQLLEQLKKQQQLQQLHLQQQLQQKQKQQQQQLQKQQQLSSLYQQTLASSSKPNGISQQALAQLTPQQQVQFLSNITNNQMLNQTLLARQQQLRLQQQKQQQQTSGIINPSSISNMSVQASIPSTSIIPTSTITSTTPNLPTSSKITVPLVQTKVEAKAGTPTISTSTISSVSNEAINKSNMTVNMSQINNLNASTPNFAPKTSITTQKQEKVMTPNLSVKTTTSVSSNTSNLNNSNKPVATDSTLPTNSSIIASNKAMSPVKKQKSPVTKVKKELSTTSSTLNKDTVNSPYLTKTNIVASPSLSTKSTTPKSLKSFSPLSKASATVASPVSNIKMVKTPPQITGNLPTKTLTDIKKPLIAQTLPLNNTNIVNPLANAVNPKLINGSAIPSVPQPSTLANNVKKETPADISSQISSNSVINSVSSPANKPVYDTHLINNKGSPKTKNEPISNKYFSPNMKPTRASSTSSVSSNSQIISQSPSLKQNEIDPNKRTLDVNNKNDNININNNINVNNNNNNNNNNNKMPMMMNNNGLKVLESLKQHGIFTNIMHPRSPFQSTKIFREISSTDCIAGPPLKISGKLLEKRKREEKFHDMVINSNVSTKKRNIKQLVNEVSPKDKLSGYTEQVIFDIADDLIDQITTFASKMAKHRNSTRVEAKDVQLSLERIWNMKLPGVDIQKTSMKKSNITNVFQQKVNYVRKDMRDRNLLKEMHIQEEQKKQKEMEKIEKEKQSISENVTPAATPNAF